VKNHNEDVSQMVSRAVRRPQPRTGKAQGAAAGCVREHFGEEHAVEGAAQERVDQDAGAVKAEAQRPQAVKATGRVSKTTRPPTRDG